MAKQIDNEVIYYYDLHPTEEDLMGESWIHRTLVQYLMDVLLWLFQRQRCAVYANLNFYQTSYPKEYPLAPDIAVIKGVDLQKVVSWRIGKNGPAPQVVFEVMSQKTWKEDLEEKPMKYALMGVEEYFAYDPHDSPIVKDAASRLFGWQLDPLKGDVRAMPLRPDGNLWSVHLDSLLVPDEQFLRLYDQHGNRRLTQAEAERRRAEALAEKLRSLGIDPDQL